ncbi:type III-B CRISPR module RAMP protein Cmr1 [Rosettibacter firmus]|uniref:type III-B CRISPR module RAMP protein Cmr1 n=1 Tax=Rosettibacter firmus TaxID=3111522 RepID=UPI00336BECDD
MIERIYNCKVITPMFLGGANNKEAELRAPSFKGVLRYWWRAMHGNLSIEQLHQNDIKIFGGSNNDNQMKSKVIIRIEQNNIECRRENFPLHNKEVEVKGKYINMNILNYLCFGIVEPRNGISRKYICPDSSFKLIFNYDNLSDKQITEIENALLLASIVGGLGSKCRNGFGKFKINDYGLDNVEKVIEILNNLKTILPAKYTAISNNTKVFKLHQSCETWDKALANLGDIYHKVRTGLEGKHVFNKRQYISAPIIDNKKTMTYIERHAKPYFLSVFQNKDNQYEGYIFCIPYKYPDNLHKNLNNQAYNKVIEEFNNNLANEMETIL